MSIGTATADRRTGPASWPGAPSRPAFQDVLQLPPKAEDIVGIPVDDLPDLGHGKASTLFDKQLLPQCLLQQAQLPADGRLRQAEFLAGTRDAAFFGDCPEVQEVVIVQPFHACTIHRQER